MRETSYTPTEFDRGEFCAPSPLKAVANGHRERSMRIATNGAEIQHNSESSHLMTIADAATVNQRVASLGPRRVVARVRRNIDSAHPNLARISTQISTQ